MSLANEIFACYILRTFRILRTDQSKKSYQIAGPRLRLAREKLPRKKRRLSSGAERSNKEVLCGNDQSMNDSKM